MAKARKRKPAKRKAARKTKRRPAKRSGKGKIPLKVLEKRANKLVRLVRSRGGHVSA